MPVKTSPISAPEYVLHREGVVAEDVLADIPKAYGINMAGSAQGHVQVIPANDANPTVEVVWWSEAAEKFVREHTPLEKAGVGQNIPFEFTVDCRGRRMFVLVTTLLTGDVTILVSGFDSYKV
jgi:hypothetical protein